MAIFEFTSSVKGKCITCKYYKTKDNYWPTGECSNKNTKADKSRIHNSKICNQFKVDKEYSNLQ